ncbi:MAG: hypothetical protein ACRDJH_04110 [Thermomicrobiales bacterium]
MASRRPIAVIGLEWDEENERHVEAHINAWLIEEMIEAGDWCAFPNHPGHPPNRWLVIGRTESGIWITAILQEPLDGDPSRWRPVTGWQSTPHEKRMHRAERERTRRR